MEPMEINLEIPIGYQFIEKCETVDLYTAYKTLSSRKYCKYTKAVKSGDSVILKKHVIKCPNCGKEIPSYNLKYYNDILSYSHLRKDRIKVKEWIEKDNVFFLDENSNCYGIQQVLINPFKESLYIQEPFSCVHKLFCPKCGIVSEYCEEKAAITVGNTENSVYVFRSINDFNELMDIKWSKTFEFNGNFPLYEKVLFDFKTGNTFLKLMNSAKEEVCSVDVSCFDNFSKLGMLSSLISKNRLLKRNIKRLFEKFWKLPLPCSISELSFKKFVLFTKFMNFPNRFYDAVPYTEFSDRLDGSFSYIFEKLHNPEQAMELFNESEFLNKKSVKRIFKESPGLFFYFKEAEVLFHIIGDVNLFCDLLKSENIFSVLCALHAYPMISEFYSDYCKVKSAKSLCAALKKSLLGVNSCAILYGSMNDFLQKAEQQKWTKKRYIFKNEYSYIFLPIPFSVPLTNIPENIPDCVICGYTFHSLRNSNDCKSVGKELHNYLDMRNIDEPPVVAVYKDSAPVASIEIFESEIVTDLGNNNSDIDDTPVCVAIQKWKKKYKFFY